MQKKKKNIVEKEVQTIHLFNVLQIEKTRIKNRSVKNVVLYKPGVKLFIKS